MSEKPSEQPARRFLLSCASNNIEDFKAFAREAARLKDYGDVVLDVAPMADKCFYEIPEGGSGWHEYTVCNPSLHKFFPHPTIAPHVPTDLVKANRELLAARVAVLREQGMKAAFFCHEPYFLPESLFEAHPHLRGARVDHPRRGRKEAFSLCVDLPESKEMMEWMTAELKRNVPMLDALMFNTNDAGSGLCWAAALYPGPNGPQHCRAKTAGRRVADLVNMFHDGAKSAGGDITVFIGHANFWQNENNDVRNMLPPNSFMTGYPDIRVSIGSLIGENTPVRGLINPLGVIERMEAADRANARDIFASFTVHYHRGCELPETVSKVLETAAACMDAPTKGLRSRLEMLHTLCARWGGEAKKEDGHSCLSNAEALVEAFYKLDQCITLKPILARMFIPIYGAGSLRHINRPLVVRPDLLTPEEEDYFLPHVFNVSREQARVDYIDLHGGRIHVGIGTETGLPAMRALIAELGRVAEVLEGCLDAPDEEDGHSCLSSGEWLYRLGTSVRIYASVLRSTYNFYYGQLFRDRHAAALSGEAVFPDGLTAYVGEPQTLEWNELMRDELDNANELIELLEERGLDQVVHADDARYEDCFLLGPDIIEQLKKKVRIMRDHWLDIEKYLAPPNK